MEELAAGVVDPPPPYGFDLLEAFAEADKQQHPRLISKYPGLLLARLQRRLHAEAKASGAQRLASAAEELSLLTQFLAANRDRYPFGLGPVESATARVQSREIDLEFARGLMCEPAVRMAMTPVYATALMKEAIEQGTTGDWQYAMTLARLTVAAADAAGQEGERGATRSQAALDFLLVALPVLTRVPDGRILREAVALGARALAQARAENDRTDLGQAEHRLGSLALDPAVAAGSTDAAVVRTRWQGILRYEYGPDFLFESEELEMPSLEESLRTAEAHYRLAIPARDGHERGRTEKALLETLVWRRALGHAVDQAEMERIGRQALADLDEAEAPRARVVRVDDAWRTASDRKPVRDAERFIPGSRDRTDASGGYLAHDPQHGLAVLADLGDLLRESRNETFRISAARLLQRLCQALAGESIGALLPDGAAEALQRAKREGWGSTRTVAAMIELARRSGDQDAEPQGVALMDQARLVDPDFVSAHGDALGIVVARNVDGRRLECPER